MSIERDSQIVFDPDGTLRATTSWISKHDEGLAELLKNVHFAYLPSRANVDSKHHVAAILLVDSERKEVDRGKWTEDEDGTVIPTPSPDAGPAPARIGVLDVGGARGSSSR